MGKPKHKSRSQPAPSKPAQPAPVEQVSARGIWTQVAIVFAVALAARLLHFWAMRDEVFYSVLISDAWQYDRWGQRLAGGDWLGSEVYYQTPLYPYLLGVLYTIFGHQVWAVRIVQAVLGALACVFLARAGARLFSQRVGWAAGLLLALYPPAIFFDGILQKASLDLFLMTAILWTLAAAQSRPRLGLFAVAGALLGLLTLNRENAAVLVAILLGWCVWISWREAPRLRWLRAGTLVLSLAAVLVPVGLRNFYVGGAFLLTTSQMGPNFYIGNHRNADGLYAPLRAGRGDARHESTDARELAEKATGRELSSSEVSRFWMDQALQDIRSNPIGWLRLVAWKWFLTWNTVELVDAEGVRVHAQASPLLAALSWPLSFGTLATLAAVGVWLTRAEWRRLWVLYAIALAFAAAVTMFFVFARYRYPLVPVLAIFAAVALVAVWDYLRRREAGLRHELLIGAAIALPVAIACNWPLPWLYNDDVTYFTTGTALLDDNRPAEAIAPLQQAAEINPRFAPTYNNLGRAYLGTDQPREAQSAFEQALAVDPNLAVAYFGLGEAAERQGDPEQAIQHYAKAVELEPELGMALRALGRIELERGRPPAAIKYFERLIQIDPEMPAPRADLAAALIASKRLPEAIDALRAAVKLDPCGRAANDLAWILATAPDAKLRQPDEAVRLSETVCQDEENLTPELLDTLAAAYAAAGRFDEAAKTAARAIAMSVQADRKALVPAFEARRQLYLQHRSYVDPGLGSK